MNTAYEALIVDFGGVLTTPLNEGMDTFADALGIEPEIPLSVQVEPPVALEAARRLPERFGGVGSLAAQILR